MGDLRPCFYLVQIQTIIKQVKEDTSEDRNNVSGKRFVIKENSKEIKKSSSKYLIQRGGKKPTQIQHEDSESHNQFWFPEVFLLLFSCKTLLNQFIHLRGHSVSTELQQVISSLTSTGLEDLSALPQQTTQQLPVQELNLRLHPSGRELRTTGEVFCETSSTK